jgi:hypothetical protein
VIDRIQSKYFDGDPLLPKYDKELPVVQLLYKHDRVYSRLWLQPYLAYDLVLPLYPKVNPDFHDLGAAHYGPIVVPSNTGYLLTVDGALVLKLTPLYPIDFVAHENAVHVLVGEFMNAGKPHDVAEPIH